MGQPVLADDVALFLRWTDTIAIYEHQEDRSGTFDAQDIAESDARYEELVSLFSQGFGDPYVRRMTASWLREFRADPEIVARIAVHEREMVKLREELNTMFQRPEWQH